MEMKTKMTSTQTKVKLQRELGLFSAVCLIINSTLGSGIFVSAGSALKNTGSVGMCLVIWVACGLLSLLGALSFAELGTMVHKSGGQFSFYQFAFADLHKFWGPLPSFIYSWVNIMYTRPAGAAIIILTFAEYFIRPVSLWSSMTPETESTMKILVGILALCTITFINYTSTKGFIKIQNVFTVCKITACLLVIVGGQYQLYMGNNKNITTGFEGTTLTISTLPMAFYSGLWAFDGWASSIMVIEEIKKPQINILMSIVLAVPLMTAVYVLMNISYLTVLSVPEMISAPAVAVEFGTRALGDFSPIIPLGVAISTFGCALCLQFQATRICFAASREGQMLEVFSYVSTKKLTLAPAVVLQVPIVIPIFVLFMSVVLFLTPIIAEPKPQFLIALAFILSAFFIYVPFVYQKKRFSAVDHFTKSIQTLMGVMPQEKDNDPDIEMCGEQQCRT
ncbi:b(0,+)-type amino acid transporter 1-like isoform X2 [Sipha flava]|uniref:B(0,+)-type amino acid transporter 1-like isoform X2 n=2 Tax=Sipha flava TaxID=143950 RepID=A0A8B8G797_9HEMI|nr:b(0,+)-type amino acid transporter 1-like isoform X2 [Sipha flava]